MLPAADSDTLSLPKYTRKNVYVFKKWFKHPSRRYVASSHFYLWEKINSQFRIWQYLILQFD